MKNNSKTALIIVLTAVLIGLLIWGVLKTQNPLPNNESAYVSSTKTSINWTSKISEIRTVLKIDFPGLVETSGKILVLRQDDIDGDGVNEATVYMGSGGLVQNFSLMRYVSGQVVTAKTKLATGQVVPAKFIQGTTSLHEDGIGILVDRKTIFQGTATRDTTGKVTACSATAYIWNASTLTYDYSKSMSTTTTPIYCNGLNPQG